MKIKEKAAATTTNRPRTQPHSNMQPIAQSVRKHSRPAYSYRVLDIFKSAMQKELGASPEALELGHIIRFDDPKGKPGNKACYCQLFNDGHPVGYFGNWRTGHYQTWVYGGISTLPPTERQRIQRQVQQAKEKRLQLQAEQHQAGAYKAIGILNRSKGTKPTFPYLRSKQVSVGICRQYNTSLVLPIIDFNGQVWSLQYIHSNGDKRFLTGGKKRGCFIPVQMPDRANQTMICEGWATGQTLAESNPNACVIAAMDAGNLKPVAIAARQQWPNRQLVICADDDRGKKINTGRIKAREAAIAAGAELVLPVWPNNSPETLTDFNDLACWLKGSTSHE